MQKKIALILLIALIFQAEAHERFSIAEQSDEWIKDFFSKFLDDFEKCLRSMAKSEIRVNESEETMLFLEKVEKEIEFYRARGIESNASLAVKPLLLFSRNLYLLAEAQDEFLKEMRDLREGKGDYGKVSTAILKAKNLIAEMRGNLDEIDEIVLYKNNTPLYFNTKGVREALDEVEELFSIYEGFAKAYEIDGIWVFASKKDPILFENVRIWIYARNVTPLSLFIDETRFEATEIEYSFERTGKHLIYAEGIKNNKTVRSNVLELEVRKIPTYILLKSSSAFIGEDARVDGLIYDYYGKRLSAPLKIFIDGEEQEIEARDGIFSLKIKRNYECSLKIRAIYEGSETHEKAYAEEFVYFLRFPVWIKIESDKERVAVGEEVKFRGETSESIPIFIIVNSEKVLELYTDSKFSFSLNFSNPGRYEVYAAFLGDKLRRPAESNRIEIVVFETFLQKLMNPQNLMLIFLMLALILSASFIKLRKPSESASQIERAVTEEKEEIKERREVGSPEELFKELFDALLKKFNLKKGLTPRELLEKLKDQGFADKLKEVVELHEKLAYAGVELSEEEKERFFKLSSEILSQL